MCKSQPYVRDLVDKMYGLDHIPITELSRIGINPTHRENEIEGIHFSENGYLFKLHPHVPLHIDSSLVNTHIRLPKWIPLSAHCILVDVASDSRSEMKFFRLSFLYGCV